MKLLICTLVALALSSTVFAAPPPGPAFITMEGSGLSLSSINEAVVAARTLGGHIHHVMPIRNADGEITGACLIGSIPPGLAPQIAELPFVTDIERGSVTGEKMKRMGKTAVLAGEAWNHLLNPPAHGHDGDGPMLSDALPPIASRRPNAHGPSGAPPLVGGVPGSPGYYQTSEFMIGSVTIGVVLPESNGNGENWTTTRQTQVYNAIVSGANWWATQGGGSAGLTFYYDTHYSVATTYEPITQPQSNEGLWISQVLTNMGYGGATYFDQADAYINAIRTANGTNWAFAAFVVDSLNDADGSFSDGYSAYSYLHGPFMVLTWDNGGWGISNFNKVFSHEMGHTFGAADEYAGSPVNTCTNYGYLDVLNGNSITCGTGRVACLMDSNTLTLCTYSKGQVGWHDTDTDGLFDPVDTVPAIANANLNYSIPPYSSNSVITGNGLVQDTPYPAPVRTPVSINTVTAMYSIDGKIWMMTNPTDGAFNSDSEAFGLASPPQANGPHMVNILAQNSVANGGAPMMLQITIDTTPPPPPPSVWISEAPYASLPMATVNWMPLPDPESGIQYYQVSIGFPPVDPLVGYLANMQVPFGPTMWPFGGLPLAHGMTCYAYVKGMNNAGLLGAATSSGPLTIDMTPPGPVMMVNDSGAGTDSPDQLAFSWINAPIMEDISGIANYKLTITDDMLGEIRSGELTGNVTTYTANGLALMPGHKYMAMVQAVNGAGMTGPQSPPSNGIMSVVFFPSIAQAKKFAMPEQPIGVNDVYVSSGPADQPGVVYAADGNRISAIGTDFTEPVTRGTKVQIAGKLRPSLGYQEFSLQNSEVQAPAGGGSMTIEPLVMAGKSLGGAPLGVQPGAMGAVGPNNVGTLVTICGIVTFTSTGAPYYYVLDDGSGLTDQDGNKGIRVYRNSPGPTDPYAWATGICSIDPTGRAIIREQ